MYKTLSKFVVEKNIVLLHNCSLGDFELYESRGLAHLCSNHLSMNMNSRRGSLHIMWTWSTNKFDSPDCVTKQSYNKVILVCLLIKCNSFGNFGPNLYVFSASNLIMIRKFHWGLFFLWPTALKQWPNSLVTRIGISTKPLNIYPFIHKHYLTLSNGFVLFSTLSLIIS